jgi:hypothetical protein
MSKIYWSWRNIPGSLRRIWQNLTRGWNDSDVWSLDHTIAEFTLPRLRRFKEVLHGHPCFEDLPEDAPVEDGMKRWKDIIDKIIFSLDCIVRDNDDIEIKDAGGKLTLVPAKDDPKEYSTLEYLGTEEQKKLHKQYMKEYRDQMTERCKKVQEGLDLFAKYFINLWD